ncbi:putative cinnamyl alcohol dehydrogenase 6 [Vitis vinifera]|uniref:Putative cinnamyl alcohol dehydrogenase 6 n=1 Tax=Vitis vinifera TaxID=29760 RepID=A0A438CBD1_VITVI|nr:putative cinnamyl alcohol dehydrogenase 6 [Vitis vinifera]
MILRQDHPVRLQEKRKRPNDVTIEILYCGYATLISTMSGMTGASPCIRLSPGSSPYKTLSPLSLNQRDKVQNRGQGRSRMLGGIMLECEFCKSSQENYCDQIQFTYNGIFWDGSITYGGYSRMLVADQSFELADTCNLIFDVLINHVKVCGSGAGEFANGCSGSNVMCGNNSVQPHERHQDARVTGEEARNNRLGGLGHVAVKFAKAFGLHVTIISTSPSKEKEAKERLGADHFIVSTNPKQMQAGRGAWTSYWTQLSANHSLGHYLELLKVNGTMVIVGAPEKPMELPSFPLIFGKRTVKGSMTGGMNETQEMMDVCGKHNITCDIEVVKPDQINEALERLANNDVRYRFVIDIAGQSPNL